MRVTLTTTGLSNINQAILPKDFTLFIGKKQHKMNTIIANILSPRIANLCSTDPTIDAFKIDVNDPNNYFNQFESLILKGKAIFPGDQIRFFMKIANELGNEEILGQLYPKFREREKLTDDNIIDEIIFAEATCIDLAPLIEYAAARFHAILNKIDNRLSFDIIFQILSNDNLSLKNETQLFDFIMNQIHIRGPEFKQLLSFVELAYLSVEEIQLFLETVKYEDMNPDLFLHMCVRLSADTANQFPITNSMRYKKKSTMFTPGYENLFDGIFSYLNRLGSKNIVFSKKVKVSTTNTRSGSVASLFDYSNFTRESEFVADKPLIRFDFLERRIILSHYSIHIPKEGLGSPRNWTLEGSNDKKNWIRLDERNDNIFSRNQEALFSIDTSHEPLQHFQLTFKNDMQVSLTGIEFFGRIYE